jgi:hypothetical protein
MKFSHARGGKYWSKNTFKFIDQLAEQDFDPQNILFLPPFFCALEYFYECKWGKLKSKVASILAIL